MSRSKLTLCLLSLLVLALASAPAQAAAGCCELKDSCRRTDDEQASKDAQGHFYQLGFCNGNKCEPSAAGEPIEGPIQVQPVQLGLSASAEPLFCPVAAAVR